jgi:CheY-like chemotaxis protein
MKILVAEDNATFRLIFGGLLKKLGHEVTAVESGLQAWNAFQREYFPVLITDWQMPEMDGMVLTVLVRAKPHDKYTYVIMLASKGGKESYLEAMKSGADDFIAKPPDEEQLAARLLVAERIVGVQNHVKRLEEVMSVCSYCKNVRERNQWVGMEQYVASHLGTNPSHTICPTCYATKVKPDLDRLGIKVDESKFW